MPGKRSTQQHQITASAQTLAAGLAALLLSSCAYIPISEQPVAQADIERCEALAERHMAVPEFGLGALLGAALGSFLTGAVRDATLTGSTKVFGTFASTTQVISIANLTLPLAVVGAAVGALRVYDRRSTITRECLRDLGHKVY